MLLALCTGAHNTRDASTRNADGAEGARRRLSGGVVSSGAGTTGEQPKHKSPGVDDSGAAKDAVTSC